MKKKGLTGERTKVEVRDVHNSMGCNLSTTFVYNWQANNQYEVGCCVNRVGCHLPSHIRRRELRAQTSKESTAKRYWRELLVRDLESEFDSDPYVLYHDLNICTGDWFAESENQC